MSQHIEETPETAPSRRRLFALLPLALVVVIGAFLMIGLQLRPREIPSVLIGKPAPAFELAALPGRPPGLKTDDLKGEVSLVNVFASWCVACRAEHPLLVDIKARQLVPVHGLNYKDKPEAALRWLGDHGDPYDRIGADVTGRTGIEFGVYGVPETFLIDTAGRIVCKQIGPISPQDWEEKLWPAIQALRAGGTPTC